MNHVYDNNTDENNHDAQSDSTADDLSTSQAYQPRFIDHAEQSAQTLNDLLSIHLPLGVLWRCSQLRWVFDFDELTVEVQNEPFLAIVASSDQLSRKRIDALRHGLRQNLYDSLSHPEWNACTFAILLLQLVETASAYLEEHRQATRPFLKSRAKASPGWDASKITDWTQVLDNDAGVDVLTVNDAAKFVLSYSIAEISDLIPEDLRLIHVEPVFRADLVGRFLRRRLAMKEELMQVKYAQLRECVSQKDIRSGKVIDSVEGIAEYLTTPHLTFHGAPKNVVASIVRYGFLVPGEKIGKHASATLLEIRCGASYGIGIYSSPSFEYASFYAPTYSLGGRYDVRSPGDIPGFRIIVCATLMGRSLQVSRAETRRTEGAFREGAQSHVSENGLEYIVFDKTQILPCYVLHVDLGAARAREDFDALKNDPARLEKLKPKPRIPTHLHTAAPSDPGAIRDRKAALRAAAAKWFPYGFGPATGTNFMIEEIGEVDDDEEEFGEFQALRHGQAKEWEIQEKLERGEEERGSWFDQYQGARETYQRVGVGEGEGEEW